MPGDYTRFTHNPFKRYADVLDQQGRVDLDADQNERGEIFRRRVRLQAVDTFGKAAVSRFSTPNAFKITGAALNIGVGRMYVDGLMAEILDGENFTYANQPFFPIPPPLNTIVGPNGIVYLDVWEREITYIQDPNLLEKALGGPDTTTRIQTVWQVKVQGTTTTPDCLVDLDALFPPSGGRLTSRAQTVPSTDDPCVLSPTGGFRGLENRLYRVEIHNGGPLGTALFKWSRDNASVVSVVENIVAGPPAQLTVSRIGRDSVLRFRIGDWVEVRDDNRELMGEPGEMARIAGIDEENRTLTLDRALGGRAFTSHTNVIRWDQQDNIVGSTGLVATAAGFVGLEAGVEIDFTGSTGNFHVGDYWVFAARTIDGTVEALNQAPPRGITHHFSQLATISGVGPSGTPNVVQDCRPIWPPDTEGCCTRVVHPGESIQAALNSLPPEGGCVCLKPGIHTIRDTIVINRPNVIMHGESIGARVVAALGTDLFAMLRIQSQNVRVEYIRFEAGERSDTNEGLIAISGAEDVAVRECILRTSIPDILTTQVLAIHVEKSNRVLLERNQILEFSFGIVIEAGTFVDVLENEIRALKQAILGILVREGSGSGPYRIDHNEIVNNQAAGIRINEASAEASISYNRILRSELGPGVAGRIKFFAIQTNGENNLVVGNHIDLRDLGYGGVNVSGSHTRVETNRIESLLSANQQNDFPVGIQVQSDTAGIPVHHVTVIGNTLTGRQDAIFVRGGEARDTIGIQILENLIEVGNQARPHFAINIEDAIDVVVQLNQLKNCEVGMLLNRGTGNQVVENKLNLGTQGMFYNDQDILRISGNLIEGIENTALLLVGSSTLTFDHNRIISCGFGASGGSGALIINISDSVTVESCQILKTGESPDGRTVITGTTLGLGISGVRNCHISDTQVIAPKQLNPTLEHRAIRVLALPVESVELLGSVAIGVGRTHLVEVVVSESDLSKITFSNNRCEHVGVPSSDSQALGTVLLSARLLSVLGNQVRADQRSYPTFNFQSSGRLSAVGNITSGFWANIPSSVLPAPVNSFNFIGV